MLCNAYDGMSIFSARSKHQRCYIEPVCWMLFFDGSSCKQGGGIGIVIILPRGASFEFAFPVEPMITNNQEKYEAILKGLQLLREVKA